MFRCAELPVARTNANVTAIERAMVQRRTKVMGRSPGETSCLSLAWAVMDLVITGGRGLGLTIADHRAIAALVAAHSVPSTEQQVA
jgi:hypothetical protein